MRVFGIRITPVSRILGIDVRPFFAWLERVEAWQTRKKIAKRLEIHDAGHKGE